MDILCYLFTAFVSFLSSQIAELITPPEATLLEKTHATINKLHQAELEIDTTLFIMEMYLDSRTAI